MARTSFFRMVLSKFSEITNNQPIFSQYNTFYKYKYFFFHSAFWSLFNHGQKSQSNQEQYSLCCSSPCFCVLLYTHYGPLQCFSTYFRKLKEIGVLRPIFPDYVISCDYARIMAANFSNLWLKLSWPQPPSHVTHLSCDHVILGKRCISSFTTPMLIQLGRVMS